MARPVVPQRAKASREDFFATTEDELVDLAHVLKRVLQMPLASMAFKIVETTLELAEAMRHVGSTAACREA